MCTTDRPSGRTVFEVKTILTLSSAFLEPFSRHCVRVIRKREEKLDEDGPNLCGAAMKFIWELEMYFGSLLFPQCVIYKSVNTVSQAVA